MDHDIRYFEQQYIEQLEGLYDASEAKGLLLYVISDLMGYRESDYKYIKDKKLTTYIIHRLTEVLAQLKTGMPIQYVLGYAWFMGYKLAVTGSVLIPRPETEELVDKVIRQNRAHSSGLVMLDIGTGSGCIAISLKKKLPEATVYALDVAADALQVARANAENLSADITFVQADALQPETLTGILPEFDVIVSNPPYITPAEKAGMHRNVLQFEPPAALFVAEQAPLIFYEQIALLALRQLKPGGQVYVEINQLFGKQVCALFESFGLVSVALHADMQGADRIVTALKPL